MRDATNPFLSVSTKLSSRAMLHSSDLHSRALSFVLPLEILYAILSPNSSPPIAENRSLDKSFGRLP